MSLSLYGVPHPERGSHMLGLWWDSTMVDKNREVLPVPGQGWPSKTSVWLEGEVRLLREVAGSFTSWTK